MQAISLIAERVALDEESFVELVVWQLPTRQPGSTHGFKYRLAYVVRGECVVRYDNEAGKGDHRHIGGKEAPYRFRDIESLQVDFWEDVADWGK
jgi:hypothetical protein